MWMILFFGVNNNTDDSKNFNELLKKISDLNLKPDYLWSNIDVMTNDGLPYVGEIRDKMFLGTGVNTSGLTNGVLAGKILSDCILSKNNDYMALFSPKRINMAQIREEFVDSIRSLQGYISGYLNKSDDIIYVKDAMLYRDGMQHVVYQHCSYMGCKLIFNNVEKTWDCPCYGSRFDIDGKCISGPANKDISVD